MTFGRPTRTSFAYTLTLLLVVGTSACSTFNRDWKAASGSSAAGTDLQGRWQGTWLSEVNGHTDQLRCLITKQAAGKYQARFHAKYQKIFSFRYAVELNVSETGLTNKFQGDANLGWYAGGRYHYEGEASSTRFFSTYHSKADYGTFQMTRPPPEK